MTSLLVPAVALAALVACENPFKLPELKLGDGEGIPPISGSTVIDVPQDFSCGTTIADPEGKYTITTSGTAEACQFKFAQEVTAFKAEDYADHPELEGAQLVKRVDLDVTELSVENGATGEIISPRDLVGKAFGETILTLADLQTPPPFTKSIEGAALDQLKAAVAAKDDLLIPVDITVTVALSPAPPAQISLGFEAQPNLVFGF
jgi:hypothetical protein